MIVALEVRWAYSFIAGIISAVNPCGFVLLPTYLAFFMGMEGARPGTQHAAIGRALKVSAAVSAGFLGVFLVIGVITQTLTDWITVEASDYLSMIIGALLIVVGVASLFGKQFSFMTPKLDLGGNDTSIRSMFLYGVSYAVASIGCTLPIFTGAVLGRFDSVGIASGVLSVVAYGLGMSLILSALTISLALARTGMLKALRAMMTRINLISGVTLLLAGLYLIWYGYTALTDRRSAVTDRAFGVQASIQTFLNDLGAGPLFIIFGGITLAAIVFISVRRRQSDQPVSES